MRSPSAKRRERKGPTSSVVRGPPMFMKIIAVGPREEVVDWVTGGATVARFLLGECLERGRCDIGVTDREVAEKAA